MKGKILLEKCEIMGHEVSPENVENPHIKRAIKKRSNFLFNHSDYGDGYYEEDCSRKDYDDYSEWYGKTHNDSSGPGRAYDKRNGGRGSGKADGEY